MVLGVSRRERRKGAQWETIQLSFKTTGPQETEKEAEDDSEVGKPVISTRQVLHVQIVGNFCIWVKSCLPLSRHERMKERKHDNKYCSFFNLCSSSIACCKQCLIFVFFFIVRNQWPVGGKSKAKHLSPQISFQLEPPGVLASTSPGHFPRCLVYGRDWSEAELPSVPREARCLVWERPTSSPLLRVALGKPKGKVPKTSSSVAEIWDLIK